MRALFFPCGSAVCQAKSSSVFWLHMLRLESTCIILTRSYQVSYLLLFYFLLLEWMMYRMVTYSFRVYVHEDDFENSSVHLHRATQPFESP